MPPRPFPYPFKIGSDICHVPRIQRIISKKIEHQPEDRALSRFLSHLLTWPERELFFRRFKRELIATEHINQVSRFLAGRWAAKEACRKACYHMGFTNGFHQIMIIPDGDPKLGRPRGLILQEGISPHRDTVLASTTTLTPPESISMKSKLLDFNIDEVEGQFCEISITHDGEYAQAVAIVPVIEWGDNSRIK